MRWPPTVFCPTAPRIWLRLTELPLEPAAPISRMRFLIDVCVSTDDPPVCRRTLPRMPAHGPSVSWSVSVPPQSLVAREIASMCSIASSSDGDPRRPVGAQTTVRHADTESTHRYELRGHALHVREKVDRGLGSRASWATRVAELPLAMPRFDLSRRPRTRMPRSMCNSARPEVQLLRGKRHDTTHAQVQRWWPVYSALPPTFKHGACGRPRRVDAVEQAADLALGEDGARGR